MENLSGIPPLGTNAFYRYMREGQDAANARLKRDAGDNYVPSATRIEDAPAYWTFLSKGRNLDMML